jgi:hypothetical protein
MSMARHALVAILWLCPALAAAQGASDSEASADKLFDEGLKLLDAGKFDAACQAFEDSLRHSHQFKFGLLTNIAYCHEKQGRTATAWSELNEAAFQAEKRGDKRAINARQRADALRSRLAKLVISVPPASQLPGLAVQRDGAAVPSEKFGQPIPVDPGSHTVEVSAPGYQAWSTHVDVTEPEQTVPVEVPPLAAMPTVQPPKIAMAPTKVEPSNSLAPKAAAPAANSQADKHLPDESTVADGNLQPSNPPANAPAPPRTSSKAVPLVVGAGALALLGTGLGFELRAESSYDAAKSEMTSQPRRASLYDSANTKRYAAEALAVSGLAAGGAAVWLYLRGDNHERDAATDTTVHVVPTTTGLALSGQF